MQGEVCIFLASEMRFGEGAEGVQLFGHLRSVGERLVNGCNGSLAARRFAVVQGGKRTCRLSVVALD